MGTYPKGYKVLKKFDKKKYIKTGIDYITLECTKGHVYDIDNYYQGSFRCLTCHPRRSRTQTDIYDFIKEYDPEASENNRKLIAPLEIDIVSDKHKFGIEYDSQTFHSSGYSTYPALDRMYDKNLHLHKTEKVEDEGYQLFHVFSSEYLNNPLKWQNVFKNKMGLSTPIYARKCQLKEISSTCARRFCEENHIQNYVNSSVRIGLYHEDELVQVMTFGKNRYQKGTENDYELLRLCTKMQYRVVGGASKLLKYFERTYKPNKIISYANRRFSQGGVYKALGFALINVSAPNYFYFKGDDSSILESRIKYQKHKLKTFESYCESKTETEIMLESKYRKIYDCGNLVFEKTFTAPAQNL